MKNNRVGFLGCLNGHYGPERRHASQILLSSGFLQYVSARLVTCASTSHDPGSTPHPPVQSQASVAYRPTRSLAVSSSATWNSVCSQTASLSVSVCICLPVCLSVSVCLSLSLSLSLSLCYLVSEGASVPEHCLRWLTPPRKLCFHWRLFVCLRICLLVSRVTKKIFNWYTFTVTSVSYVVTESATELENYYRSVILPPLHAVMHFRWFPAPDVNLAKTKNLPKVSSLICKRSPFVEVTNN